MSKNKKKKSLRRHRPFYKAPLFFLVIILLVIFAGFACAKYLDDKYSAPTPDALPTENTPKPDSATSASSSHDETSDSVADNPDGKTPEQYEGKNPNLSETLTGTLSTARFSCDKLLLRVNIDQYLSSGTCSLTVSDGSRSLSKTASVVPEVSTSSCEGFDIPASELSNFSRPLSIQINITSGSKSGLITGSIN